MRLIDKVAIVTGAGKGIGKAIAQAYADQKAHVVLVDRDAGAAHQAATEIAAGGGVVLSVVADIANETDVDAMIKTTIDHFGTVDVMVCNAGVGFHRALLDTELSDWERILHVNLTGTFLCTQRAARAMKIARCGSIIIMGSTSGQRGAMARTAYGVSKAGVMQLTRIAATELARYGIRVNAIAPGPITTSLSLSNHTPEQRRAYLDRIPMGRYGEIAEVAAAAVFLASSESSYINGHVLNVDGGMNEAGLMFDVDEMNTYAR
ncbi:MAG: SDR family NAD(P)-dependent oxidoreductase, partial [Paralcaligenes sp.]